MIPSTSNRDAGNLVAILRNIKVDITEWQDDDKENNEQ